MLYFPRLYYVLSHYTILCYAMLHYAMLKWGLGWFWSAFRNACRAQYILYYHHLKGVLVSKVMEDLHQQPFDQHFLEAHPKGGHRKIGPYHPK